MKVDKNESKSYAKKHHFLILLLDYDSMKAEIKSKHILFQCIHHLNAGAKLKIIFLILNV